ncbi:MAG: hypothetical protein ACI8ZM_002430 [Crocinitomix sp.]|jgi:hypothetical protein
MKVLLLILCFSTIGFGQDSDSTILNLIRRGPQLNTITHYSGYFGKLRMSGHIVEDSLGNTISLSKFCQLENNTNIWFYQLIEYHKNGNIKYDSIVDFRNHKKLKIRVYSFQLNGSKKRILRLKSKIEINPNEEINRDMVFWNGFEKVYHPAKAKKQYCKATLKDLLN